MSKDGNSKVYGIFASRKENILLWEFEEDYPVIGLYGYQKEDSTNQIT